MKKWRSFPQETCFGSDVRRVGSCCPQSATPPALQPPFSLSRSPHPVSPHTKSIPSIVDSPITNEDRVSTASGPTLNTVSEPIEGRPVRQLASEVVIISKGSTLDLQRTEMNSGPELSDVNLFIRLDDVYELSDRGP